MTQFLPPSREATNLVLSSVMSQGSTNKQSRLKGAIPLSVPLVHKVPQIRAEQAPLKVHTDVGAAQEMVVRNLRPFSSSSASRFEWSDDIWKGERGILVE